MNEPSLGRCEPISDSCTEGSLVDALSSRGLARRGDMLVQLKLTVVREHRRRDARRRVFRGTMAAALVIGVTVGFYLRLEAPPSRPLVGTFPSSNPDFLSTEAIGSDVSPVRLLKTTPGALVRYRAGTHVQMSNYQITDRQLLQTLAEIGRPSGLVRQRGRTRLTEPVTDAERSAKRASPRVEARENPTQHS